MARAVPGLASPAGLRVTGGEEIVADPAMGKRGNLAGIEIETDFIAGTEDGKFVVGSSEASA